MIAITIGDAAGIGPEIVLKALDRFDTSRFVVYGGARILRHAMDIPGVPCRDVNLVGDDLETVEGKINVVDMDTPDLSSFRYGVESAACGRVAYECIAKAVADAMDGRLSCVCTAPLNKVSLRLAGIPYIGHTEIFASLTGCDDPLTMFQVDGLRVFFLSRHVSLVEACRMVTYERLMDYIPRCIDELRKLKVEGTLAVAGLNPHCGEHGLFGNEERCIEAAVSKCRSMGLDVSGPVGADSVFHQCLKGRYGGVLSLYHDQGHIAAKTYDFDRTISVTLGMKVLRFSVDHGTAFDIAGKGVADETGMVETLAHALSYEDRVSGIAGGR